MEFTKMQGLGNDFVIVELTEGAEGSRLSFPELAVKACDRHFGIGADGLVLMLPSEVADVRMRIFNPDGSEPEMCGNAIRCVAARVFQSSANTGRTGRTLRIETLAGVKTVSVTDANDGELWMRVDMGAPILEAQEIPVSLSDGRVSRVIRHPLQVEGTLYKFTAVSMGNPHAVVFVDDLGGVNLLEHGPAIENHDLFPRKTNVEFAEVISSKEVKILVYERGAGPTLACGTGACATTVAGILEGRLDEKVLVHLPGGDLTVEWAGEGHSVYMSGPAVEVFRGTWPVEEGRLWRR